MGKESSAVDHRLALISDRVTGEQRARFEGYLREIFEALGLPQDTASTQETPARFLRAFMDATEGYEPDPDLATVFPVERDAREGGHSSQIVEVSIPFTALCEHHALPFFGHASVGYVADSQLIGVSKLTRLVRQFARRFTMQEHIGQQVAAGLQDIVGAAGTAVYLDAVHLCTWVRGVREVQARTRTITWLGCYETSAALRAEFLRTCHGER